MASIQEKGNKFYVVVSVPGQPNPDWIPFNTRDDADDFKDKVEKEQKRAKKMGKKANTVANATRTVSELLDQYIEMVGKSRWGVNNYEEYKARVEHYIRPHIGELRVWECNVLKMDEYFTLLKSLDAVEQVGKERKKISTNIMDKIHVFLKAMFNQAIEWEYMDKNPCKKRSSSLPEHKKKSTPFWTMTQFMEAAQIVMDQADYTLLVAMFLALSTGVREGEVCGLQWPRIFIAESDIIEGDCRLFVDRQLCRVKKSAMEALNDKEIIFKFPAQFSDSTSLLVLKDPKTDKGKREVWIPRTIARMLLKLRDKQNERKAFMGSEYKDFDLVICHDDGRPMEPTTLLRRMKRMIIRNSLPHCTFHGLRRTSTMYKLRMTNGDIKSVQGDGGWTTAGLVTDVYAQVNDEDRKYNAQRFDDIVFSGNNEEYGPAATRLAQQITQTIGVAQMPMPMQGVVDTSVTVPLAIPEGTKTQFSGDDILNLMAVIQNNPDMVRQLLSAVGT